MKNNNDVERSFMILMISCLVALVFLIGAMIHFHNKGFRFKQSEPEPGMEQLTLLDYLMDIEAATIREAPSGKIYHVGDKIDLNDYLGNIDPEIDWNYTEGDQYTDSILSYFGVFWDSDRNVWTIK